MAASGESGIEQLACTYICSSKFSWYNNIFVNFVIEFAITKNIHEMFVYAHIVLYKRAVAKSIFTKFVFYDNFARFTIFLYREYLELYGTSIFDCRLTIS